MMKCTMCMCVIMPTHDFLSSVDAADHNTDSVVDQKSLTAEKHDSQEILKDQVLKIQMREQRERLIQRAIDNQQYMLYQ